MAAGAGIQAGVSTVGGFIGGRIVSGLGMGIINSTAPVLQAEASPKASRGRCESRSRVGLLYSADRLTLPRCNPF